MGVKFDIRTTTKAEMLAKKNQQVTTSKPRITAMRGCYKTWLEGWAPTGKELGNDSKEIMESFGQCGRVPCGICGESLSTQEERQNVIHLENMNNLCSEIYQTG